MQLLSPLLLCPVDTFINDALLQMSLFHLPPMPMYLFQPECCEKQQSLQILEALNHKSPGERQSDGRTEVTLSQQSMGNTFFWLLLSAPAVLSPLHLIRKSLHNSSERWCTLNCGFQGLIVSMQVTISSVLIFCNNPVWFNSFLQWRNANYYRGLGLVAE